MTKAIKYMWGLFLFTFPFSIRFLIYEDASYRFGNFNPWVTGFVYLPEILLGIVFVLWLIRRFTLNDLRFTFQLQWLWILFGLFALNAFVVTLLNGDALLGAMFILRLFEGFVVFLLITDKVLEVRQVITILLFGALLQIIWGYFQFKTNGSLGLQIFGESVVGPNVLGVAKIDLADGTKQVRAYGSFLHPNIFAAYLLTIFFLSLRYLKYGSKLFWFAVFLWGIFLTHSRAAMLIGLVGLGIYFVYGVFKAVTLRKSIALVIILLLAISNFWFFQKSYAVNTRDASLAERLTQNVISKNIWKENPWGVGVRNFTLEMEKVSDCGPNCGPNCGPSGGSNCEARKYLPWEFQPVHNTYFLILNEVGIQGLLLLLLFLLALFDLYWKSGKAVPILILLMLAPFDHFLWDSWVGMMLVALVAGFFTIENHKEGIVEKIEHVVHIASDS